MSLNEDHISGRESVPVQDLNGSFSLNKEVDHEKELALVRRIEALNVYDSERLNLLMVWRGIVPTANFIITTQNPPLSEEEQDTLYQKAEALFADLDLKFKEKTDYPGHEHGKRFYQVAQTEEILNEFIHIDFSDRKNSERIGLMFGIPLTAAHAYAQGPQFLIRDEDIPLKIRSQDYMAFSKFWFSREHWQDELATVKNWAEQIRNIDPKLYERLVDYHKVLPFPLFKMGRIKTEEVPHAPHLKYIT